MSQDSEATEDQNGKDDLEAMRSEIRGHLKVVLHAREFISWDEATQLISEEWLGSKGYGPPTAEVRKLLGEVARSGDPLAWPPLRKGVAAASPVMTSTGAATGLTGASQPQSPCVDRPRCGPTECESRISPDEALRLVAAAIAARDQVEWLGPLNGHQERLISYYVEGNSGSSIRRSHVTYCVSGQNWAKRPSDPKLVSEIERAIYQRDLYEEQCDGANDWLDSHVGPHFSEEKFSTAMLQAFPAWRIEASQRCAPVQSLNKGEQAGEESQSQSPSIGAETACKRWLKELMRENPERPKLAKADYLVLAKRKFSRLSQRRFDVAWGSAIEEVPLCKWSAPGPRGPRKNPRT